MLLSKRLGESQADPCVALILSEVIRSEACSNIGDSLLAVDFARKFAGKVRSDTGSGTTA